jgi:replication factor C subunit 2/4
LLGDFIVTHNTSSILAIANELLGPRKTDERAIELNASDERGISIVRGKIMTLAKMSVSERDPNYTCPPYKIIILDEADAMTIEAQSALRKIMEDNSNITRFCFVCNFINQIIGPIISRCAKFRFKSIELKQMNNKLLHISNKEGMDITLEAIETINHASNGDMRKAITLLQNLKYLDKKIDVDDVCNMACIMPKTLLNTVINTCTELGDGASKITKMTNNLIMQGYPLNDILYQIVGEIAKHDKLNDKMKSIICFHIANTEQRLINGADEFMQLLSIFMCIKNVSNELKSIYDI